MKILGKIALIFTGCFLLFAVIGNIALSFNGGVKASFQQVYDRLEEVWPYELFGRAEESLDQIADRLDPPQKAPDSSSSGSGSSSSGGHGSSGSQDTVSGQDAYQVPAGGLWEIDVKAQGCSVEIAPGDPGSQVSVVLERKNDQKLQLEVYQEEEELPMRASKRGLIPSDKQDAVLRFSMTTEAASPLRETPARQFSGISNSREKLTWNCLPAISREAAFRERRFPSPLPPLPSPFPGFAGSWIWSRAWATPA